jgi:hypothetical protein
MPPPPLRGPPQSRPLKEIKRLHWQLLPLAPAYSGPAAEQAATAAATAAAGNLEADSENRRLQLLLAGHVATEADTAAADRVFVPGYAAPITMQEPEYQLQALHCQVVRLQQHLDAAVRDAQIGRTAPPHKTPLSSVWGRAGRPSRRRATSQCASRTHWGASCG